MAMLLATVDLPTPPLPLVRWILCLMRIIFFINLTSSFWTVFTSILVVVHRFHRAICSLDFPLASRPWNDATGISTFRSFFSA